MKLASKGSTRLPRKSLRQLGIALALSTTAFGAHAAGLGKLSLMSGLGQPLRAEIELNSVARDEIGTLTARVASADAFAQAGIEYGSSLTGLRFSIQRRASGQQYVLVTSTQLVNEPFLDVLVELSWGSGRLVREYTLLLDPPEAKAAQREVDSGATVVQAQSATPTVVRRAPTAPTAAPSSSSATPSPAPAPSRAASTPRAAPVGTSSGEYVVQNGDNASSIARANKPESVSLDQMLAALYRDNQKAFSGNINLLMAGATLKIPDAASAQSIESGEARRIIAESANFGSYREKIARNAAEAPTSRTTGQQASGKLSTQVDDRAAPASEAKDRLQLSRPDAARTGSAATGAKSGVGGPTADELAAKDRELQESRTRLALLEKNVTDLQELLKLKNQTLADIQKGGATKGADVAAPSTTTTPAPSPAATPPAATTVITPPVATPPAPVPAPVTPPVAATPPPAATPATPAPAPVKVAPANPAEEPGFFDSLMDNSLLLVGLFAIVLLVIGYAIFTARRRSKLAGFEDSIFVDNSVLHANSVFGTTGGQSVDTANSGFHSNFVPVAGNLPEQNEVDPVAEADVYIAYGRDAQAEEILREALRSDASRHAVRLKLLEIYAKRGDAKTFETMASELYAATGGQGEDWKQAAALGATIDPRNPLYSESPIGAASIAAPVSSLTKDSVLSHTPSLIGEGLAAGALAAAPLALTPAFDTSATRATEDQAVAKAAFEHAKTDPMPRTSPNAPTSTPSMDLDFDLGNAGVAPLQTGANTANAAAPAPAAPAEETLDFSFSQSTKPLVDPFTASAFGGNDPSARTAVNLPAFRARAEPTPEPGTPRVDADGFTASDIFGTSIVNDTEPMYSETPKESTPVLSSSASTPPRAVDFRHDVDGNQNFEKTEPIDAFSKINLDLDESGYTASDAKSDFGSKTDVWQAMATKLDLALAYSDIGDKEGARELLEEVVRNGDQVQADRARQLIGELG
jgi:pilus assembly protein FimV